MSNRPTEALRTAMGFYHLAYGTNTKTNLYEQVTKQLDIMDKEWTKLKECVEFYAKEEEHKNARENGCYVTGKRARNCLKELDK